MNSDVRRYAIVIGLGLVASLVVLAVTPSFMKFAASFRYNSGPGIQTAQEDPITWVDGAAVTGAMFVLGVIVLLMRRLR
jgi:hypothetical protein